MDEILEKYTNSVLKNIDSSNMKKIISFLEKKECHYIEDIVEDYLDLFTIDYELFIEYFDRLNEKYHHEFLTLASEDMNLWEEFFH